MKNLLTSFRSVVVLATEKQKGELLSEYLKSIEAQDKVSTLQSCLHLTYTDEEFAVMQKDILLCKHLDYEGIVIGLLNKDASIDKERTKGCR